MNRYVSRKLPLLALVAAVALLGGCTSNNGTGDGGLATGGGSGGSGGTLPNNGTTPTNITNNGSAVSGNFVCTLGAKNYGNVTTAVGSNGLVGGPLTNLLNTLGGNTATTLLNSVTNPNNVIDGNLSTYATFSLTAGLLGGTLDSVDLDVLAPSGTTIPSGTYAVFGVSFPAGTVGLSVVNQVTVATYLNGTLQEKNPVTQSQLSLLGTNVTGPKTMWLGLKTTKAYDRAALELQPNVLSADVGDAMHAYEFCVDGKMVPVP